ncbi:MAG: DUF3105 domain-containing protein [Chloroflexi bacterium]|nr:MAG: DUF3105 domain-containing protein [Chloroflexota bacterium]
MSRRAARSRAAEAQRRARRRSFLAVIAVVVAVIVVTAAALTLLVGKGSLDNEASAVKNYPYPVQMFPPDPGGRTHIPPGQPYNYNSNPPTSGPHTSATATPGAHGEPVPKETAVHNMEHSQIVVWYNCNAPQPLSTDACNTLKQSLAAVVSDAITLNKRVVMTPYSDMEHTIALTAWQFLDVFDQFDAQRVRTFIDTFYCHTNLEGFC